MTEIKWPVEPQRPAFARALVALGHTHKDVVVASADVSSSTMTGVFAKHFPERHYNFGIAEQNMISIAAGLALGGKIVFCYGIAPFLTMRCYEQIRVDLCCMNLPVTLVGVGAGYSYDESGPTHHGLEDIAVMRALPNMTILSASDSLIAASFARLAYEAPGPKYVRLDRTKLPLIYDQYTKHSDFSQGYACVLLGHDLVIVGTGYMVHKALQVAQELDKQGIATEVIDLYRIKPISQPMLQSLVQKQKPIVTLEENFISGGIGTAFAEFLADAYKLIPLKRFGIPDQYWFKYGGRDLLHKDCGLDVETIMKGIFEWIR